MKTSRIVVTAAISFCMLALGLFVAGFGVTRAADEPTVPAAGTAAPDFTLNSQESMPVSLHDYRGKWVVLYFYPKDMSTGCTIEAHGFQRDADQYDKKKAVILGVSVDTVDSHKEFCAKDGLNFKLLSDPDHAVSAKYGSVMQFGANTVAARNTFLINPKGVIVKVFTKVQPTPHSEEVLSALTDLQK
jgi:thioredoxin-dependent peroxiredoxin